MYIQRQQPILKTLTRVCLVLLLLLQIVSAKGGGSGGGGGGGRGGGSSGGSAGVYHGGRHRSGGGGSCNATCRNVILGIVFGLLGLCFCVSFGYRWNQKQREQDFLALCEKADKDVTHSALQAGNACSNRPVVDIPHGEYTAMYTDSTHDNGTLAMNCNGNLSFAGIPALVSCRSITGSGTDEDGGFTISQGKVAIWTGKACWIETASTKLAIKSLVTGTFQRDPYTSTLIFQGRFVCSNQAKGTYIKFEIKPTNTVAAAAAASNTAMGDGRDVNLVSNAAAPAMPHYTTATTGIECAPYDASNYSAATTTSYSSNPSDSGVPSIFRGQESTTSYNPPATPQHLPTAQASTYNPSSSAPPLASAYIPATYTNPTAHVSAPPSSLNDNSNVPSIFRPPPV